MTIKVSPQIKKKYFVLGNDKYSGAVPYPSDSPVFPEDYPEQKAAIQ